MLRATYEISTMNNGLSVGDYIAKPSEQLDT